MSHSMPYPKLLLSMVVLLLATLACSLGSGGDSEEPTPVPLLPTATAQTSVTITPTVQVTATPTQQSQNSGGSGTNTGSNPPACTPRNDWYTYTVKSGDTLSNIAQRTNSTVQQLTTANCLRNADSIVVGQVLRVPNLPPTTSPSGNLYRIEPTGNPPANQCVVRNLNPNNMVYVYTAMDINSTKNAILVTYAPHLDTQPNWYQILIPESGLNYVMASQVTLEGNCPNRTPATCQATIVNVGGSQTPVHSGAGENYPISTNMPVGVPIPVLAFSGDWVQVGTDFNNNGWVKRSSTVLAGPCDGVWTIPIEDFETCYLTMNMATQSYTEPNFNAAVANTLQPDVKLIAQVRTVDGWYGFIISQPPDVPVYNWLPAGVQGYSHIIQSIACGVLPYR